MGIFTALISNPKTIFFESQERGEKVYFILRRHPITNLGWMFVSILMILTPPFVLQFAAENIPEFLFLIPANYQLTGIIFWYLLTLLFTFEEFLIWYFNVYIITDRRVIDVDFVGLWTKRISEATLDKVEDATYETSRFLHVLLDYGDISMQTAAEKREFEFRSIPQPGMVHDKLTDLVEAYKRSHK